MRASAVRRLFSGGRWHDARIFRRERLSPGQRVDGPALIIEANQTIVVEPGWRAEINAKDHVLMRRFERSPMPLLLYLLDREINNLQTPPAAAEIATAKSEN